jgi:tRNA(Arg) A34 adenosine deaminase TadA
MRMRKINKDILHTLEKIAAANPNPTEKFAAAVVWNNKIISIGMNSMKSHPLQAKYSKNEHAIFLHSEIDAIKNALREIDVDDFSKCDLYITRVKKEKPFTKKFVWGLAKPCAGCERAIAAFGLKRTIYTCDEGYEIIE